MSIFEPLEDDCRTAEDVERRAAEVRERRRQWARPRVEPVRSEPEPQQVGAITLANAMEDISISALCAPVGASFCQVASFAVHREPVNSALTIREIQRAVCLSFGITFEDLLCQRRDLAVVVPRHIAMMLCKLLTRRSLPEIGRKFAGRDHTSILHACRKLDPVCEAIKPRLKEGPTLDELVFLAREAYQKLQVAKPRRKSPRQHKPEPEGLAA